MTHFSLLFLHIVYWDRDIRTFTEWIQQIFIFILFFLHSIYYTLTDNKIYVCDFFFLLFFYKFIFENITRDGTQDERRKSKIKLNLYENRIAKKKKKDSSMCISI